MKQWSILESKKEYALALKRVEELSINPPDKNSVEGRELMLLGYLIDKYEEENFSINLPDPIEAIKVRMEDLSLTVQDLLDVFGDRGTASKVLNGKRPLSLTMIRMLAHRLSLPVAVLTQPVQLNTPRKRLGVNEPKTAYKKKRSS